jgi:hypothetical protein
MTAFWLIGILAALSKPLALREEASDAALPVWLEISERTTCEAMQDDYCLGRVGPGQHPDPLFHRRVSVKVQMPPPWERLPDPWFKSVIATEPVPTGQE